MKKTMIETGDVRYSKLTDTLTFTVACGPEAIEMIKDISYQEDLSPEEMTQKFRELFQGAVVMTYHRGGFRRKYD